MHCRGRMQQFLSTTALDDIDAEFRDALTAFLQSKGLPVKLVTTTVGRANPPDSIKNQRVETATQEQRIQTEKQVKMAEDERMEADGGVRSERAGHLHVHSERRSTGLQLGEMIGRRSR
jgi:regulator of protease activity HflC (stomatin/prohibitin superfamily)